MTLLTLEIVMPKYYKPVFFNWELPVPSSRNHMSCSWNLKHEINKESVWSFRAGQGSGWQEWCPVLPRNKNEREPFRFSLPDALPFFFHRHPSGSAQCPYWPRVRNRRSWIGSEETKDGGLFALFCRLILGRALVLHVNYLHRGNLSLTSASL